MEQIVKKKLVTLQIFQEDYKNSKNDSDFDALFLQFNKPKYDNSFRS